MLFLCGALSEVVPGYELLRYPIPKSLSSGKGLAFASLKAVNVICYFNVVPVWCFVCGCAGLWCHLLRFFRKTVTGALGKAGTCNTFAAKL